MLTSTGLCTDACQAAFCSEFCACSACRAPVLARLCESCASVQLYEGRCCRNGDVLLTSEPEEALLLFPGALENGFQLSLLFFYVLFMTFRSWSHRHKLDAAKWRLGLLCTIFLCRPGLVERFSASTVTIIIIKTSYWRYRSCCRKSDSHSEILALESYMPSLKRARARDSSRGLEH